MRNKIVWLLSMAVLALPLIAAEEPAEKAKPAVEETATPEQASEIAELREQILLLQQRLEKLEAERQQEAMVVTVEEAQQEKEQGWTGCASAATTASRPTPSTAARPPTSTACTCRT